MLELRDLTVSVGGRVIIKGASMRIGCGETVALFGPNGSGKTTLLNAIMGFPGYRVEGGSIVFRGRDITGLPLDERARLGLGLAFQRPPAVRGVRLGEVLALCSSRSSAPPAGIEETARKLALEGFMGRDLNLGFSGGEVKRSELLQLRAQDAALVLLDEPDSGVDLVSIVQVAEVIGALLQKERPQGQREKAGLIITHTGHILDYVGADRAYVLLGGSLVCSGEPREILNDIRRSGFEGCLACVR